MKRKILYVIAIIMLGAMLLVFTGCGKKEENNNQAVQEEEKKEVKRINDKKNIVYTVKEESGYKIPKINLAYDNIKEVNKEILEFGEKFLADITVKDKIEEGGKLEYQYYENDNILSIVYEYESPFAANSDKYKVWNVDKYTGEIITNEQILAKKGIKTEDFQAKYTEQCKAKYEEMNINAKETMPDLYNEQYEKTVSTENNNVSNHMYLGEDNEINMITKIYSPAAADYYEHIVTVKK